MSLPQTITTQELIALTGYSAPALVDLERAGVVGRQEKDTWLIGTVGKIVAHLRERTRRSKSAAEERLADAKARALEMRMQREAGDLVPTAAVENYTRMAFGRIRVEHSSLPARYTRNVEERQRLEKLLDEADTRTADYLDEQGDASVDRSPKSQPAKVVKCPVGQTATVAGRGVPPGGAYRAAATERALMTDDRRLKRLLKERDQLIDAWQRNTREIAGLSTVGALLDLSNATQWHRPVRELYAAAKPRRKRARARRSSSRKS